MKITTKRHHKHHSRVRDTHTPQTPTHMQTHIHTPLLIGSSKTNTETQSSDCQQSDGHGGMSENF